MQKNESTLLDAWLKYHAALFGVENLYIVDNGSTDEGVLQLIREWERYGLTVERGFPDTKHFVHKGTILGGMMRDLRQSRRYDFLLPLDCDEFLALEQPDRPCFDPGLIHGYLAELRSERRLPQVTSNYLNVPGRADLFIKAPYQKVFFQAEAFVSVDLGNHVGCSSLSDETVDTRITYMHLHAKPFEMLVEHSRDKLLERCDIEDPEAIEEFGRSGKIGHHLAKYLLADRDEYLACFDSGAAIPVPGFAERLREVGADVSTVEGRSPAQAVAVAPARCAGARIEQFPTTGTQSNTILLLGQPLIAVFALSTALAAAGVQVSDPGGTLIEPGWWARLLHDRPESARRWLLIRAAQPGVWSAYCPTADMLDAASVRALRNPRVILVQPDPGNGAEAAAALARRLGPDVPLMVMEPEDPAWDPEAVVGLLMTFLGQDWPHPVRDQAARALSTTLGVARCEGWIDEIVGTQVRGWCWQKGLRSRPVLKVSVDGAALGEATADLPRDDLRAAGKGDGRYGFVFDLGGTDGWRPGTIAVQVKGTPYWLENSGRSIASLQGH